MLDLFSTLEDFNGTLYVRVTAKAAKNYCKIKHNEDGSKLIRVYVTAVAENNKANNAVLKLLAKELGLAKSRLQITHGHKTKDKIIEISDE
jgi:uncharacterized protein